MREKELKEGLGDLAHRAEQDHEVQMARAELYKLAKYAIKLHDMLKGVSEAEGLEGWVQSKITKAAADIGSVYHHLDYQESEANMGEMTEAKDTHCSDKCCGSDVKAEDCTCPPSCKHCNCNSVKEGKYKSDAQRKAVHASKAEKKKNESLEDKLKKALAEKSVSKAQQQAAGIALAAKEKGETPKGKGAAAQMAKMSKADLKDFAGTKHTGLPKHKK